jgi:ectoine hydroxylase-related dioxygenase (phytanoyl-CoA dioxygenase family)
MLHIADFAVSGYAVIPDAISREHASDLAVESERLWTGRGTRKGGIRGVLSKCSSLRAVVDQPLVRELVNTLGGGRARPVRSILFDKTPDANWHVPWHQDTTIAVSEQLDTPGYGPWSLKDGVPHCRPPRHVLEAMFTLRIHLDSCDRENGPLRVIPGTHHRGILNDSDLAESSRQEHVECMTDAGGVLVMHPLILHSSPRSTRPGHRRVLHVEYCMVDLDGRLSWCEGL